MYNIDLNIQQSMYNIYNADLQTKIIRHAAMQENKTHINQH